MSIDRDVNMVAGVGRRPLAQVLRNSLSGHTPTTGHETIFEENTVTQALGVGTQDANCAASEQTNPNSRRHPVKWATNYSEAEELDYLFQIFAVDVVEGI